MYGDGFGKLIKGLFGCLVIATIFAIPGVCVAIYGLYWLFKHIHFY